MFHLFHYYLKVNTLDHYFVITFSKFYKPLIITKILFLMTSKTFDFMQL